MNAKHTPEICDCHERNVTTGIGVFPDGVEFCPLHAAAPELLEALKHANDLLKAFGSGNFAVITNAIAKAEGRA